MSHKIYPHVLRRYKTSSLLAVPLDELVGPLLHAFRKSAPEETPILPRESLSLDALNEALEAHSDLAAPYGKYRGVITRFLMEAWQECVNSGYVAPLPKSQDEKYDETPYFITRRGNAHAEQFQFRSVT